MFEMESVENAHEYTYQLKRMRFQVAHFIQKLGISPDQKGGYRHDDVLRLEMV